MTLDIFCQPSSVGLPAPKLQAHVTLPTESSVFFSDSSSGASVESTSGAGFENN